MPAIAKKPESHGQKGSVGRFAPMQCTVHMHCWQYKLRISKFLLAQPAATHLQRKHPPVPPSAALAGVVLSYRALPCIPCARHREFTQGSSQQAEARSCARLAIRTRHFAFLSSQAGAFAGWSQDRRPRLVSSPNTQVAPPYLSFEAHQPKHQACSALTRHLSTLAEEVTPQGSVL
jgi:hypothetical protein